MMKFFATKETKIQTNKNKRRKWKFNTVNNIRVFNKITQKKNNTYSLLDYYNSLINDIKIKRKIFIEHRLEILISKKKFSFNEMCNLWRIGWINILQ